MNNKVLCSIVCAIGCWSVLPAAVADVQLRLANDPDGKSAVVQACGIPDSDWATLAGRNAAELATCFQLFVKESREAGQPVLGSCRLVEHCLVFTPRFPLRPGVLYVAELRCGSERSVVRQELSLPKPTMSRSTQIAEVYPTADVLPQNLLKFYIHFTAPMSQGEAYRFIELATVDGQLLEKPFLEIAEELWDRSGQRLTLLLDPGRVKRGLVPREEDGPILLAGQQYRLTIKADWPDARGVPLAKEFVKRFRVSQEDFTQPDPVNWTVTIPRVGTTESVTFGFPESLDHATAASGISLENARGEIIPGTLTFSLHETRAHFAPLKPWPAGFVNVRISPIIEDLAGNSIERAFEVDRFDEVETARPPKKGIRIRIAP